MRSRAASIISASVPGLVSPTIIGGPDAKAQGVLPIGTTASDIPLTTDRTDNGVEGMRFLG